MKLTSQRRIAAQVLKCGEGRIWFDRERLPDIKQAITKADIRHLIGERAIQKKPKRAISHGRLRKHLLQRRKGRRQGQGSRKGKRTARLPKKKEWMVRIRGQRAFIRELRDKAIIAPHIYHLLYKKAKGGFFRSKRHIKLYMEEHKVANHEAKKKTRVAEKKA